MRGAGAAITCIYDRTGSSGNLRAHEVAMQAKGGAGGVSTESRNEMVAEQLGAKTVYG